MWETETNESGCERKSKVSASRTVWCNVTCCSVTIFAVMQKKNVRWDFKRLLISTTASKHLLTSLNLSLTPTGLNAKRRLSTPRVLKFAAAIQARACTRTHLLQRVWTHIFRPSLCDPSSSWITYCHACAQYLIHRTKPLCWWHSFTVHVVFLPWFSWSSFSDCCKNSSCLSL